MLKNFYDRSCAWMNFFRQHVTHAQVSGSWLYREFFARFWKFLLKHERCELLQKFCWKSGENLKTLRQSSKRGSKDSGKPKESISNGLEMAIFEFNSTYHLVFEQELVLWASWRRSRSPQTPLMCLTLSGVSLFSNPCSQFFSVPSREHLSVLILNKYFFLQLIGITINIYRLFDHLFAIWPLIFDVLSQLMLVHQCAHLNLRA